MPRRQTNAPYSLGQWRADFRMRSSMCGCGCARQAGRLNLWRPRVTNKWAGDLSRRRPSLKTDESFARPRPLSGCGKYCHSIRRVVCNPVSSSSGDLVRLPFPSIARVLLYYCFGTEAGGQKGMLRRAKEEGELFDCATGFASERASQRDRRWR